MRGHGAHDEVQVVVGDVVLILVVHHLERFFLAAVTVLVGAESRLHFPIVDLMPVALVG